MSILNLYIKLSNLFFFKENVLLKMKFLNKISWSKLTFPFAELKFLKLFEIKFINRLIFEL